MGNQAGIIIRNVKNELFHSAKHLILNEVKGIECLPATNRSSLILLFNPGRRFLLLGDATCASIKDAMKHHDLTKCTIKVPHHGSKHNLSTEIIEELDIVQSVISANGSKKHPSSAIVHWLSKYGNVYSTHKSGELIYHSENTRGRVATPLRSKHS